MRFSIITPILNRVAYVRGCVNSTLNQTYPDIEHVLIDGGSTDGTLDVLTEYQSTFPGRVVLLSEPDNGPCDAWNKGLRLATGQVLGWLGADDTYKPDTIETVSNFFWANTGAMLVHGDMDIVDEAGTVRRRSLSKSFDLAESVGTMCTIFAPATFYRREVLSLVGMLDLRYRYAGDIDWFIRMGKKFPLHYLHRSLVNFRYHSASVSSRDARSGEVLRETVAISWRHGAGVFSPIVRRYCLFRLFRPFASVLRPAFHSRLLNPVLSRLVGRYAVDSEDVEEGRG